MKKESTAKAPEDRRSCAALAIWCGVLMGAALMVFLGTGNGGTQFIRIYCCAAVTFLIILVLYHFFRGINRADSPVSVRIFSGKAAALYAFVILAALIYVISVRKIFAGKVNVSGTGGYIVFCFLALLFAGMCAAGIKQDDAFWGKPLLILTCVFTYFVFFLYAYAPNIFNQSDYVLHHYAAVTQTIYNAAYNTPYTISTSGVYGHYAIMLWPILKLFGHTPQVIAIILAVLNCIILTSLIAVTLKLTENNFLRSLSILAAASSLIDVELYAAVRPLRCLWPFLIMTYAIYGYEYIKNKKYFAVLGYILCSLAITWQTDSGIAATVAFTISLWIHMWKTESAFSVKAFLVYGTSLLGTMCSVLGMVAIVNLYNILCGGPVAFKDCFFPLLQSGGYVSALYSNLLTAENSWLIPVCIFIVSIAVGLLPCSFLKVSQDCRKINLAICGVMGLGQSYYYLNRAIASWNCVYFYFFLCIAYLVGSGFASKLKRDSVYSMLEHAVGLCGVVYLCIFVLNSILIAPAVFHTKLDTKINTMDSISELSEAVEAAVPKDTYAFGHYTQEVYAYLDWDPGYHMRDVSDFFWVGLGPIHKEIGQQDTILVSRVSKRLIETDLVDMYPVASIPEKSPVFDYYVKLKNIEVLLEKHDFTLADVGDYQYAGFPITIKKDTIYKVELTLAEDVDFSTAAALTVDFSAPGYDRPEQEASYFVKEGTYQYTFYFNSGEFDGGDVLSGAARVFDLNMDTFIPIESFSVTEMEIFDPTKSETGPLEENESSVIEEDAHQTAGFTVTETEMSDKARRETMLLEKHDFILTDVGDYQYAGFPITIKKDTIYKVELTLAKDVDFSTAAALTVDFSAPGYDRPEQEASYFVKEGTYQYTFYFNSGEFDGGEVLDCAARVFDLNMDTFIPVESFSVTEIEILGQIKSETRLLEENNFSLIEEGGYQTAVFPVTIRENTTYKVELALAEDVDFSTAAALIVDFFAPGYDRPEQEASYFVKEGTYRYTFYFNSGEFDGGSEELDCMARVFVWNLDTFIHVEDFSVDEIELLRPEESL